MVKQESVVINHNQQGGGGYIQINNLSKKLVTQFEKRLLDKDAMIKLLQETNASLQVIIKNLKK